jgi:hypothetical protein
MAIIFIIPHKRIIGIINYYCNYCNYGNFFNAGGLESVGSRAWLQEPWFLCHFHSKYHGKTSCGSSQWHKGHSAPQVCSFQTHLETSSRVMAMDAGCGLSTSGHLDGPWLSTKQNVSVAFSIKKDVCLVQSCVMHRKLFVRAKQHGELCDRIHHHV